MKAKIPGKYFIPKYSIKSQFSEAKSEFTILSESMATLTEMNSVWEVYNNKFDFRELVPLKPSRVILHALAIVMQCNIKQEIEPGKGEETFKHLVLNAYEEAKKSPNYKKLIDDLTRCYNELDDEIVDFIRNAKPSHLTDDEQKLITKLLTKVDKALLQTHFSGVAQGIRAYVYMHRARKQSDEFALSMIVRHSNLPKLPELPKKDTIAVFTVGGPASGKSSSLVKIAQSIDKMYQVKWDEFVHTNVDRSRIIFVPQHTELLFNDSLTSDEGRLLKAKEMEYLVSAPEEKSHHQLHDSSRIDSKAFLHHALLGKAIVVCLVSADFETAIKRSYLRGNSERRYVTIESLFEAHKYAPESLIKALSQQGIRGTNTTVFMYDNNVAQGQDSILFGTINSQSQEICIYNEDMLLAWIKKMNIIMPKEFPKTYNPQVDLEIALYSDQEISIAEYFEPLTKQGYRLIQAPQSELKHSLI